MHFEAIRQLGVAKSIPAGAYLQVSGEESTTSYLLIRGCITLSLPDQFPAVDIFWPGDMVGGNSGRLRAVVASECRALSQTDLLNEMARQPEFTSWLWRQQQQRMDVLRDRILWLRRPVEQRLVRTLLALDIRAHESMTDGAIPLTQRELAELAGATRETTSTILNRWSTQGIVELQRRRLRVLSQERLLRILSDAPELASADAKGAAA